MLRNGYIGRVASLSAGNNKHMLKCRRTPPICIVGVVIRLVRTQDAGKHTRGKMPVPLSSKLSGHAIGIKNPSLNGWTPGQGFKRKVVSSVIAAAFNYF
jgi:hypothetical protein